MVPSVMAATAAGANPLSFDLWTFIFQAINVLIVMFVLYKALWGPLSKVIADREQFVETSLNRAAEAKDEAEKLLAQYQEQLRNAEREARAVVEQATRSGDEARQRIIAEAEAEAQRMVERAKTEIAREREKALAQIREEVAGLVMLATHKVLGRAMTDEDHRALILDFVDEVQASMGSRGDSASGEARTGSV